MGTTASGGITFTWSDTGFGPGANGGTLTLGGNVFPGSAPAMVYSAYIDSSNTLFGTGALIGTISFPTSMSGAFTGTASGPGTASGLFAMTEVAQINLAANSQVGVDFQFKVTPAAAAPLPECQMAPPSPPSSCSR